MSALLLVSVRLDHMSWACEQVGLLNFTPEFDRLAYPGTDVAGQAFQMGACLLGQGGTEYQCSAGLQIPKGRREEEVSCFFSQTHQSG